MKKQDLIARTKQHIYWIKSIYPDNPKRALDQSFGFIQGVCLAADDEKTEEQITNIWNEYHASFFKKTGIL